MTVDYSEVEALRERKAKERSVRRSSPDRVTGYLDRLDAVAGHLTELVESEGWNIHRAHLTGNREQAEQELTMLRDRLVRGPETGDALAALKLRAAFLQGLADAYRIALSDVQEVIDIAVEAKAG